MTEKIAEELNNILQQELNLYKKLKNSAEGKKEAIIENEVDQLADLVSEEEEIIARLEEKEQDRNILLNKLEEEKKIDTGEISFASLLEIFSPNWQEKLSSTREELLAIIEEMESINQENRSLLEEAIKLNNFSLNMLYKAVESSNQTYTKEKKSENKQGYNIIDRKA